MLADRVGRLAGRVYAAPENAQNLFSAVRRRMVFLR
jgi:hypothetical protein